MTKYSFFSSNSPPVFTSTTVRPLGAWIVLVVLVNILFCTTGGYGGDIAYWTDWITQLQTGGYAQLNANYPPVYVHWLWLIGQFEAALKIPVAPDAFLRFLTNSPILLAHVGLLLVSDRLLAREPLVSDKKWNLIIGFVALNPAILMNGPIWGQVDLLFSLMLVLVLCLLIEARCLVLVFPLLLIALLTKFQSVCIAPVVLPLLWHRRCRALWLGLLPAVAIAAALLLPYLLAGSAERMFDLTYLKAASLYPYATYHANNLWYLIGLNERPDSLYIFNFLNPVEPWQKLLTPKPLGMLLCSLWGLVTMISSWRRDEAERHWRNAILAAMGFFLFLPAMHERYMMPAVILAVAASARYSRFTFHSIALSVLAAGNMVFVLHPTGGLMSYVFSALTLIFALAAFLPPGKLRCIARFSALPIKAWAVVALGVWIAALTVHLQRVMPNAEGWIDATSLPSRTVTQEWSELRIGSSVDSNALSVNKQQYRTGFGTHAASTITLKVPPNAQTFTALVGVDDESKLAELEFLVRVDGRQVWKSGTMKAGDSPRQLSVSVKGQKTIELIADPLGANTGDHADWLEPRFLLAQ